MHEAAQASVSLSSAQPFRFVSSALSSAMPVLLTLHRWEEWDETLHGGKLWWWFIDDHEEVEGVATVWYCWMWYLHEDFVEFENEVEVDEEPASKKQRLA